MLHLLILLGYHYDYQTHTYMHTHTCAQTDTHTVACLFGSRANAATPPSHITTHRNTTIPWCCDTYTLDLHPSVVSASSPAYLQQNNFHEEAGRCGNMFLPESPRSTRSTVQSDRSHGRLGKEKDRSCANVCNATAVSRMP